MSAGSGATDFEVARGVGGLGGVGDEGPELDSVASTMVQDPPARDLDQGRWLMADGC